ncbi:hypothetical protein ACH4FE_18560 [Streptomyces celluloflavus]|uniref:hypothetical protein n=1 Tax=Streptomyces celluloflavus TaxID=58344 RepID=UPI00379059D9
MKAVLRAGMVLLAGWLTVVCAAGTGQAAPAPPDDRAQTAYLADRLRENPVYISDQFPREVPRSTAPEFAEQARRVGVPTYVLVLPGSSLTASPAGLLAGVHDRLGRPGLYVAVDRSGLAAVETYGVSLPEATDARRATLYELPYDATAREVFRRFVDVLTSGKARQRLDAADAGHDGATRSHEPARLHMTRTDRENQSFVTGLAVTGIPLAALLVTVHVWRRRRVRRALSAPVPAPGGGRPDAAPGVSLRKPAASPPRPPSAAPARRLGRAGLASGPFPRALLISLTVAALALSGLIAFTASRLFTDTTSGDGSYPTAADMRARVDRVADGLRRDPLYVDPESPSALDAADRARLRARLGSLRVPVLIAAVPTSSGDESGGNPALLAAALHDRLHRDALIVIADPATGSIAPFNHGAPVNGGYLIERPRETYTGGTDLALGSRLDAFLGYVAKSPPAKAGATPYPPEPATDPVQEKALPGLFTGDFRPGLLIGAFLGGLVFGLVALALSLARRLRHRLRPGQLSAAAGGERGDAAGGERGDAAAPEAPKAPERPDPAWLRRTAREEIAALTAALDPADSLSAEARRRAWECLDATALLIDGNSDGRMDADAAPADLACAVVLARAGRTAIRRPDAAAQVCHRNPLHGAASGRRQIRTAGSGRARSLPVCQACRAVPGPVLRLGSSPRTRHDAYVPYATLPGPLATLADGAGIDQLTRTVREYFGVH